MHFPDSQPCRHRDISGFEVTKSIMITMLVTIIIMIMIVIIVIVIMTVGVIIITTNSLVSFLNLASINVWQTYTNYLTTIFPLKMSENRRISFSGRIVIT